MDPLLEELVALTHEPVSVDEAMALELLLADALACLSSAVRSRSSDSREFDAADVARFMSQQDLDDVDWASLHHPGSVVTAASLIQARRYGVSGPSFAYGLAVGYRVAAAVGRMLDPGYRNRWHATAVCGCLGAAAAGATVVEPSERTIRYAINLAALSAGGLALAPKARNGAATFTRAAAATVGLVAADAAHREVPTVSHPLNGEGGFIEVFSQAPARKFEQSVGASFASVRLFPTTGFAHAAVWVAAQLSERFREIQAIDVRVSPAALAMNEAGGWWDISASVAASAKTGDPFRCSERYEVGFPIRLSQDSIPVNEAELSVAWADGSSETFAGEAPGSVSGQASPTLWDRKAHEILGVEAADARRLARLCLTTGVPQHVDVNSLLPRATER